MYKWDMWEQIAKECEARGDTMGAARAREKVEKSIARARAKFSDDRQKELGIYKKATTPKTTKAANIPAAEDGEE